MVYYPVVVGLRNGHLVVGVWGTEDPQRIVRVDDLGADTVPFYLGDPTLQVAASPLFVPELLLSILLGQPSLGQVQPTGLPPLHNPVRPAIALFYSRSPVPELFRHHLRIQLGRLRYVGICRYDLISCHDAPP